MTVLSDLWLRVRALFRRKKVEAELDDELRFHLESQIEKYVQAGMTPEEAKRRTQIELGGIEQVKEECRDARGIGFLEDTWRDVRYGARMLRKSPGFTIVAILTLALGIGANTAIFSLVDAVFFRELPFRNPQGLVLLAWHARRGRRGGSYSNYGDCIYSSSEHGDSGCSFSYPMYAQFHAKRDIFSHVIAVAGAGSLNLSGNGQARIVEGRLVSGNFFETLGVRAAAGRTIDPSDDRADAPPVAVISYRLWQSAFGGSPSVVGRAIQINNVAFTIIGVAERQFTGLTPGVHYGVWVPLSQATPLDIPWVSHSRHNPRDSSLVILGRLKPGLSLSQAQAAASLQFRNEMLHGAKPLYDAQADPRITLASAQESLVGMRAPYGTPLLILMLCVGIVLVIACANVAGLTLARSASRQKEMSVRLALGAGRGRVVRQLLSESLPLAGAGGLLGCLFAYWGVHALTSLAEGGSPGHFPFPVSPDLRILGFVAAVSILSGILAASASALRAPRVNLVRSLKERGGESSSGSGGRAGWFSSGNVLVVGQVALAVVLLAGAGLLLRTLRNLENVNPGFETRNVLLFGVNPALLGYNAARTENLYSQLRQRLAALPGVASASYSSVGLLAGDRFTTDIHLESGTRKRSVSVYILNTGPGFFRTLHVPLVAGRYFDSADFALADTAAIAEEANTKGPAPYYRSEALLSGARRPVGSSKSLSIVPVLVNQTFVRQFLGTRNPLGLRLGEGKNNSGEIVGVVGDTKYTNLRQTIEPTIYLPLTGGGAHFELRTAVSPDSLIPAVRGVVAHTDPRLPITAVKTQAGMIQQLLSGQRFLSRLLGFFALLALALACIGLYGLLSYDISRKTHEIGIRMALGAQRSNVLRFVMGRGLALAIAGVAIGTAVSLGVTRYLRSLLYGVKPTDPATFVAVSLILIAVALLACYIPARRAMRVDPATALRHE